jgi:hypothetical protein
MKYIFILLIVVLFSACTTEKQISECKGDTLKDDINQSIIDGFYDNDLEKAKSAYFIK